MNINEQKIPNTPNPLRYRSDSLSQDKQIVYAIGGV